MDCICRGLKDGELKLCKSSFLCSYDEESLDSRSKPYGKPHVHLLSCIGATAYDLFSRISGHWPMQAI
jgi:hypothetical protein